MQTIINLIFAFLIFCAAITHNPHEELSKWQPVFSRRVFVVLVSILWFVFITPLNMLYNWFAEPILYVYLKVKEFILKNW